MKEDHVKSVKLEHLQLTDAGILAVSMVTRVSLLSQPDNWESRLNPSSWFCGVQLYVSSRIRTKQTRVKLRSEAKDVDETRKRSRVVDRSCDGIRSLGCSAAQDSRVGGVNVRPVEEDHGAERAKRDDDVFDSRTVKRVRSQLSERSVGSFLVHFKSQHVFLILVETKPNAC